MTAIGKLTSQIGQLDDGTRNVLEEHVTGTDVELRQVSNRVVRICQPMPCYISCLVYCQSNKGRPLSCAIFFPALFRNSRTFSKRFPDAKCATFRWLLWRTGGEWIRNNSVAFHFCPAIGHLSLLFGPYLFVTKDSYRSITSRNTFKERDNQLTSPNGDFGFFYLAVVKSVLMDFLRRTSLLSGHLPSLQPNYQYNWPWEDTSPKWTQAKMKIPT